MAAECAKSCYGNIGRPLEAANRSWGKVLGPRVRGWFKFRFKFKFRITHPGALNLNLAPYPSSAPSQ